LSDVTKSKSDNICLACGLCCNGVIFADVKLQPAEDPEQLRKLGLPVVVQRALPTFADGQKWKWPQPCQALEGCRCKIYADRPLYCQQFDCALLKRVQERRITTAGALRLIRQTRGQAETVLNLLRALGNTEESLALGKRFSRVTKQIRNVELKPRTATYYSQLTLAFHELTLLLSRFFYPGSPDK
jgi:uncharacterized protein